MNAWLLIVYLTVHQGGTGKELRIRCSSYCACVLQEDIMKDHELVKSTEISRRWLRKSYGTTNRDECRAKRRVL